MENIELLRQKKLWLLDMDGTIYLGNKLFDGVKEFLQLLKARGKNFVFITNNSSKSISQYIKKLNDMGIACGYENFFSSSMSSCLYIKRHYKNAKVYLCGTKALKEELERSGICLANADKADLVLLGYDTELTYQKIVDVCNILKTKDVPYLATNADILCPASPCYLPDCGTLMKMIEAAVHKMPYVIGKPNVHIMEDVLKAFNCDKKEAIIVGDRLYTDIASANNANIDSICVLSGEADKKAIEESEHKPSFIYDDILQVYNLLR